MQIYFVLIKFNLTQHSPSLTLKSSSYSSVELDSTHILPYTVEGRLVLALDGPSTVV